MNQQECQQAGINYAEGVARFVGNASLYEHFLAEFLKDGTFAELEQAMAAGDAKAAFNAAHTLKGLTGNLSLSALYGQLVPFVDALRGEADLPRAHLLFPAVQQDYRQTAAFLAARLG